MPNSNTREEAAAISYFLNSVALMEPGSLVGPAETEAIRAAARRIERQIAAASAAGSVTSDRKRKAKRTGRPREANPSPAALAKRRSREKGAK